MKALIFGANGQDGFYLTQYLQNNNIEVLGISRSGTHVINGDISNRLFVEDLIKSQKPDFIINLAANSTTSHQALFENHDTIASGSINILESVYKFSPLTKVFLSGSGLQFQNHGIPIKESDEFSPSSPYAVARIYTTYLGRYYRSLGLKVYVGYFFNHESPRRSTRHVSQMISTAVRNIANGKEEKITIGDLSVKKEWTFAQDVVKAVWTLINQDSVFECNIGSGKAYSIEDWIKCCFKEIGKDYNEYITTKPGFKSEYGILVSDPSLIKSLGWDDTTSLEDLAKIMLTDDRHN